MVGHGQKPGPSKDLQILHRLQMELLVHQTEMATRRKQKLATSPQTCGKIGNGRGDGTAEAASGTAGGSCLQRRKPAASAPKLLAKPRCDALCLLSRNLTAHQKERFE